MAPKNPTQNHVAGDQSDEPEEVAAPLVAPMKPKFSTSQKLVPSESVESGSACSSPSASGFIIAPSQKPFEEKDKKKKKASASKVFSDEDIIAMLKGLAVFWANGRNNKWADFHLFIKDDLRNQFTKTQVSEKIRTLKKKFDSNSGRARANGGCLDLSDPHESAVFELSKALWGEGEKKGQVAVNGDEEGNEIRRERKNDEGSKITRRRKQGNGEGSKNLMKKRKQLGEHGEEDEKMRKPENGIKELSEGYEGDERDAANTILSICKLVDEHVDDNTELVKEGIQVEEHDESNEQKQVDECHEGKKKKKKKKKRKGKQVDEHQDEKEELLKEGKGVDESEERDVITKEENRVDGHGKMKHLVKKRKQVDDHSEENNIPAKNKQKMEIRPENFQYAFPLLYASFDIFRCPKIAKESCVLIGQENALELEEKWRELNAEMHHIELKKLGLMKKSSKDGLQTK